MNIPENLLYTKDHEWVALNGEEATVGITDFAQGELGDIIFVEFPGKGASFDRGAAFGTIEAVKTVADLFMPVSGEINEINASLDDAPEKVNSDPYGEGWIVKLTLANPSESQELLDAEAYRGLLS